MDGKSQETVVETTETTATNEKSLGQKIKEVFTGKKDEEPAEDVVTAEEKVDDPEDKTATNGDVDLATAIEQAKQEAIAEYQKELEEKERKSKLSPEELKAEEDAEKDKKIIDLEHQLMVRNCHDNAVKTLDEKKLPVALADILDYTSEESATKSLDVVAKTFTECLENAVKERLKGRTPTGLNSNNDINSTADMQAKIFAQMGVKTNEKK